MASHRRVEPQSEQGIKHVITEMTKLGYASKWKVVDAEDFFLPQHRSRVWMLFVLRPDGEAAEKADDILRLAFEILDKIGTNGCSEPLFKILARVGMTKKASDPDPVQVDTKDNTKNITKETATKNDRFIQKHSLTAHDLRGREGFHAKAGLVLTPRAKEALFLNLCLRRKVDGWDWTNDYATYVATAGQSVEWVTVMRNRFPTVTPKGLQVIIKRTPELSHELSVHIVTGHMALAAQGVQTVEAKVLKLNREQDTLLHDFAGNSFTANICAAFIIAALAKYPVDWWGPAKAERTG